MTTCIIYKISNSENEKVYIGQTWKSIERRFCAHKSPKGHVCRKLHNAFNKHGRENFKIEAIAACSDQLTADYLESLYIKEYDSIEKGYNLTTGGSRGVGWKHSEEAKKKIGLASQGNKYSLGNKSWLGKQHSDITKTKISKTKIDQLSYEFRKKCGIKNKGKTWKIIDGKRIWLEKVG